MISKQWVWVLAYGMLLSTLLVVTGLVILDRVEMDGADMPDTRYRLTYVSGCIEDGGSSMHGTFYFDEYEAVLARVLFIKYNGNEEDNTCTPAIRITSPYYTYDEVDGWEYKEGPAILVGDFVLEENWDSQLQCRFLPSKEQTKVGASVQQGTRRVQR